MIQGDKKPLLFEYEELKRTLTDFVDTSSGWRLGASRGMLAKSKNRNNNYNVYGRIITKKEKNQVEGSCTASPKSTWRIQEPGLKKKYLNVVISVGVYKCSANPNLK